MADLGEEGDGAALGDGDGDGNGGFPAGPNMNMGTGGYDPMGPFGTGGHDMGGSSAMGGWGGEAPCPNGVCDVDCAVSDWGEWQECSAVCGGGDRKRYREILEMPEGRGEACPILYEYGACNMQDCPTDCEVGEWGEWSECSETCGGGTTTRERIVVPPSGGGQICPASEQHQVCNIEPCPVDCEVGEWGEWSACLGPCGGGERTRTRSAIVEPSGGGAECPLLSVVEECNPAMCVGPL